MKFKKQVLFILIAISLFSSCSKDDGTIPTPVVKEPEIKQTAILNITSEDTAQINFGDVVTNITATRVFTIENSGNSDLNITNFILPDNFTIDISTGSIAPNSSKDFTVTFIPTEIADYSDSIKVQSNATSGSDNVPVIAAGVNSIYEGSVILKTQEEVEDFAKLGYTEITVALYIGNIDTFSQITSLASLNKITDVGSLQVISTTVLEDLSGLENLNVSVSIQLLANRALKNVDALLSVTKLSDYLSFLSNEALTQIDGLANITEVGDNLRMKNHPLLENLDGLSGVTVIKKDLIVEDNPLIENLNGLSFVETVSSVRFKDNGSLYDYCGIKALLENDGLQNTFYLTSYNRYNPTKFDLINNECLKEVPEGVYDGNLSINSSFDINKFESKGFHTISGSLGVGSENINSLDFLSNLTTVMSSFTIRNSNLTNLEGLEKLIYVGQLWIQENTMLSDYCSLNSFIENGTIGSTNEEWKYLNSDNLYNPTLEDLQNGLCTE